MSNAEPARRTYTLERRRESRPVWKRSRLWAVVPLAAALACGDGPEGSAPDAAAEGVPAEPADAGRASPAHDGTPRAQTDGGNGADSSDAGEARSDAGVAAPEAGVPSSDADMPAPDAGPTADAGNTTPPSSTGPGDWGPGDYPPDLMSQTYREISGIPGQNGHTRGYKVHVPPSYDPNVPAPLVFCIHGLGQNAVMFCVQGASMPEKSDEEGFVLVMPNGYQNSWNGGTCCGAASNEELDDVALFRAIFEEVGTHVNVDLDRVYATGLSNGGFMSFRLACEAADLFTAMAPAAGAVGTNDIGGGTNPMSDFTDCSPSRPISVLGIHGTADGLVSYSLHQPSMDRMASSSGCASTTSPATVPMSGGDTTCVTRDGCPNGIEITSCTVDGGGHCWFGSSDCGTGGGAAGAAFVGSNSDTLVNTDAVWSFFERLSR